MFLKKLQLYNEGLKYRHEFKYEIDTGQVIILKERLSEIMEKDKHVGDDGSYRIRSLYFDDYHNSGYYDNENGYDPREKYRIRIYNGSSERIRLELKRKESGKTLKKSCDISCEQAEYMMKGQRLLFDDDMPALLKKFYILQETKHMTPKVIVEYDRIPFVCAEGNVRVTLDLNISACSRAEEFLKEEIGRRPIMAKGRHLLEVKYDEYIPEYIKEIIHIKDLQQTTYSKYYLCRRLGGIL